MQLNLLMADKQVTSGSMENTPADKKYSISLCDIFVRSFNIVFVYRLRIDDLYYCNIAELHSNDKYTGLHATCKRQQQQQQKKQNISSIILNNKKPFKEYKKILNRDFIVLYTPLYSMFFFLVKIKKINDYFIVFWGLFIFLNQGLDERKCILSSPRPPKIIL